MTPARDKGESEVGEAGTCYASSDVGDLVGSHQDELKGSFPNCSRKLRGADDAGHAIRNHVSRADVAGSSGYRPIFELQQVGPMQLA
ncbi:hypothetical protein GQ457_07G015340 [Hibiscus cannabinus]